jgi:hypothetical protein
MMTVECDVGPEASHRVSPFDLLDCPDLFELPHEPKASAKKKTTAVASFV